jgi:hypothetical protein
VTIEVLPQTPRIRPVPPLRTSTWRERRAAHRRLAEQDRRAAHLAELDHIRALVREAELVVRQGWLRGAWFSFAGDAGRGRTTFDQLAQWRAGTPVAGACLAGAIVHAGGGPGAIRSQPVQRALELTWHTLYRGDADPVRWCPAPAVRAAHVRDLARWNDVGCRTRADVTTLLGSVESAANAQIARTRAGA